LYDKTVGNFIANAAYLVEKYSSTQTAIASIKIKFNTFPMPRSKRIKKRMRDREITRPRRELAKSKENVKSKVIKSNRKNSGTAPNVWGSTK